MTGADREIPELPPAVDRHALPGHGRADAGRAAGRVGNDIGVRRRRADRHAAADAVVEAVEAGDGGEIVDAEGHPIDRHNSMPAEALTPGMVRLLSTIDFSTPPPPKRVPPETCGMRVHVACRQPAIRRRPDR